MRGDRQPTKYAGKDTNCEIMIKAKERKQRSVLGGEDYKNQSSLGGSPWHTLSKDLKETRERVVWTPGRRERTSNVFRHSRDRRTGAEEQGAVVGVKVSLAPDHVGSQCPLYWLQLFCQMRRRLWAEDWHNPVYVLTLAAVWRIALTGAIVII